jgi:hypothetical protein
MTGVLGISPEELPVIWDADFLFGPKTAAGHDTWVLCEINVSAVWPFPPGRRACHRSGGPGPHPGRAGTAIPGPRRRRPVRRSAAQLVLR